MNWSEGELGGLSGTAYRMLRSRVLRDTEAIPACGSQQTTEVGLHWGLAEQAPSN